jgi:osmoprotectant transport system ATP-binding protein
MDEPFSAVDPVNRSRLQAEFLSIQRRLKKTIVFVTHDIDEAVRLADRIALLRGGRLVQYDEPETILDSPIDDFVADFFGSDRALRRLSRFPVRDWMRPYGGPRSGCVPSATVDRDASLRDALSAMLSGRSRDLVVVGDSGGPEGELEFGDIELAAGDPSA